MLATRPGSSASAESSAAAASTTAAARAQPEEMVEKRIAGVSREKREESVADVDGWVGAPHALFWGGCRLWDATSVIRETVIESHSSAENDT